MSSHNEVAAEVQVPAADEAQAGQGPGPAIEGARPRAARPRPTRREPERTARVWATVVASASPALETAMVGVGRTARALVRTVPVPGPIPADLGSELADPVSEPPDPE
jgi:hypothetical protein